MKIAIHNRPGSFSDRWIDYCRKQLISYKIVNCYDSDIIQQVKDCDALMWHHHQGIYEDVLAAKNILFALEHAGIKVFPDFKTSWHFDDKVAQKYLFEALDAPLVPSYVFYDKNSALDWANTTSYPKVFKLRGGAGSANVKLARTKSESTKLINKAFGKGFQQFSGTEYLLDTIKKYKSGTKTLKQVIKAFGRMLLSTEFAKNAPPEKGYAYFQDFIPNNNSDIRVIIVGERAFALKRLVRKNDFRASGSGSIVYNRQEIPEECIRISFELNAKIKSQSIAFDYIFDSANNPLVVEISYAYAIKPYDSCEGYYTDDLQFHSGKFNPQEWMVEYLINNG